MGFITHNGNKFNTDKKGTGEIYQEDPEQIKEFREKVNFDTRQARTGADHQRKLFIDRDGDEEELEDFYYDVEHGKWKPKGYGMAYSHPRHLNNRYDVEPPINNFKDMDRIIDEEELLRVIDEKEDGRTISTGTKVTPLQLAIIKANFDEGKERGVLVRAKITSNSRKKFKNFEDFYKAVRIRDEPDNEDKDNKGFDSHIGRLSEN